MNSTTRKGREVRIVSNGRTRSGLVCPACYLLDSPAVAACEHCGGWGWLVMAQPAGGRSGKSAPGAAS